MKTIIKELRKFGINDFQILKSITHFSFAQIKQ